MNKPGLAPKEIRHTKVWEHAVRFLFGGVITVATGLVAKAWGPAVAGLFLAFPAILPASITLVMRHDGRDAADDDARGALLGSLALLAFALVVWSTARELPAVASLALASVTWLVVGVAAWFARYGRAQNL